MKQIAIAIVAISLFASCTEQSKCVQCTTTEKTSHGIVHGTTVTLEVCGEDEIQRYYSDNNKTTREAQWIGPGVTDSMIVEIERRTECGGYTYSN